MEYYHYGLCSSGRPTRKGYTILEKPGSESRLIRLVSDEIQRMRGYKATAAEEDIARHFMDVKVLGIKSGLTSAKRTAVLKKRLLAMTSLPMPEAQRISLRNVEECSKQIL